MLRCRCQACHATFLDGGQAERCPGCGRKGKLQPISIAGGPPLEAQLAELAGTLPSLLDGAQHPEAQAMVTATVRRSPLRKAGAITVVVASALALLQAMMYVVFLAILGDLGGLLPGTFHTWGAAMAAGGLAGLVGAIMTLQHHGTGRMLAIGGAAILLASMGLLFLPGGPGILVLGFLLTPLTWLGALGGLVLLSIPDRPVSSDSVTVTAVGPLAAVQAVN